MVYQRRKTRPPSLPSPILSRQTLLHTLEDALLPSSEQPFAAYDVVLLRAPAGYGKTTLLGDFARRSPVPVGWYFLDQTDAQFLVFIQTLTAVLSQEFPSLSSVLPSAFLETLIATLQAEMQVEGTYLLHQYTDLLEEHIIRPFILCLCNYHEINDVGEVRQLVNYLLLHMPSHLSLVIESRSIPSLEFSSLLARRRLLGLGSNMLGFSPQEVQAYAHLQHHVSLSEAEATQLATSFEGWIAGLLLATPLGDALAPLPTMLHLPTWGTPALISNPYTLLAYLRQEVFAQEKQALGFLQETSALPYLDTQSCNMLLQRADAEAMLMHIERQGLFVTRVPHQGTSPRYALHPMLRQILAQDFRQNHSEQATILARRAAELLHEWGNQEEAFMQAITAQAYPLAIAILTQYTRMGISDPLQEATLACWLDLFPAPLRDHHPRVLLTRATIALTQHEPHQAAFLLNQALEQLSTESPVPPFLEEESIPILQAEILIAQSTLFFQKGQYTQTREICCKALDLLPFDQTDLRFPALHRLGICSTLMGDYSQGLAYLHQALQWGERIKATREMAAVHASLANSYSLMCHAALSEHHRMRAIALCEQDNDTPGKINNLIWMAILKQNTGAFQEAETILEQILPLARAAGISSSEAYILFNIGANALDQDAFPQALSALEESLSLARHLGDSRLADQCLCELAMVHLYLHEYTTAQILLAQTTASTMKQPGYEAVGYELARGTLLLYQHDAIQAAACFQALESRAHQAQFKRVQMECLIRLAVCYQEIGREEKIEAIMEKVVQIANQGYFEHIPLFELHRFPEVWRRVQRFPDHACLPSWRETPLEPEEGEEDETSLGILLPTLSSLGRQGGRESSPAPTLQLFAFGDPRVLIDGQLITRWRLARSLELCFFLLDYHRPIRKEQLVEALWSEDEEYVDQAVRSTLYYLRKALGSACLLSQAGLYTLDLSALYGEQIWYDVAVFQHHWTQAQAALEQERDEQAEKQLQAMIELYSGDYVQSFYGNWCIPRRDELRTQCRRTLRELAHLMWRQERWEESLAHWQRLVAFDSCDEEAHEGIMRGYIRLGKRNLAIQQYQRCKEILQRELTIAPGPNLQKYYQRITASS